MTDETNSTPIDPAVSAMMSAYIQDAINELAPLAESMTTRIPIGAVVTANLTVFVQMLAIAGREGGRTAEETKTVLKASVDAMADLVDEIYRRLEERDAKTAQGDSNA